MDVAVIGLKAHSETIKEATKDLKGMSSASKQAEAANRSREKSDIAAAGAAKANAIATKALASASGAAAFRQRQLAVQSLDVAQSLALGMPPMMVAIQQGGQLAGIYAGQGGIKGAFQEATASVMRFTRANPALIAVGIATAALFSGMTYEINKTTDVSVGFGDVFKATMHVAKDAISGVLKPAVDAIAPFVQAAWDASVQYTKNKMNSMIGVAVGAYKYIMAEWSNMPAAFADISIMSANALISWAKYGANEVIGIYGDMLAKINSIVGTSFSRPGMITDDLSIANPFAGAASSTAGVEAFREAMNYDYLGSTFDAIRDKAVELAIAGQDAGDKLSNAAKKAIDPWDDLRSGTNKALEKLKEVKDYAADLTKGFVSELRSGLEAGKGFWNSFGDAAMNVLNKIMDTMVSNSIDSFFGGMTAGSTGGGILSSIGSLLGFSEGGYTGNGGKYQPAGVVHGGEYVFSKDRVNQLGLGFLENLHGGYAQGGYVGASPAMSAPTMRASSPANQNIVVTGQIQVTSDDDKFKAEMVEVSASVVQSAAPSIVSQSTADAKTAFSKGGFDSAAGGRFGLAARANSR